MRVMLKIPTHNLEVDKICFETWMAEGSLKKAGYRLKEKGIVSSHGTSFSDQGIYKAAQRYMIRYFDETKQMLMETYKKNGYLVEERYVDYYLIKIAIVILHTPERVKFWLIENNLLEKHRRFIDSIITIP